MKLIVAGGTGFVGKEVVRQSLSRREITSVVALARKPVPIPDNLEAGAEPSKLKSIVVKDYGEYPDEAKEAFAGAGACIWTVAITPTRSQSYPFEEVKRVCQTCTLAGFQAMHAADSTKPFRFLYMSGAGAERDQTKPPRYRPQYSLMRGETETKVLSLGAELDAVEVGVVRPGIITKPGEVLRSILAAGSRWVLGMPSIDATDLANVMLDQVIDGLKKNTLEPVDLARIAESRAQSVIGT